MTLPDSRIAARLDAQIAFLREADALKSVVRASRLIDDSRRENSAEHSWHVMLYALVLAEHAGPDVSVDRVLRMLLIHDIVEIDAGDTPIHGTVDAEAQDAAEQAAAARLFGLLPDDQAQEMRALWDEFEAAQSADAQFAKAIDRFQTPIANLANDGGTWRDYAVTLDQMDRRVGTPVAQGAPTLWGWLRPKLADWFSK